MTSNRCCCRHVSRRWSDIQEPRTFALCSGIRTLITDWWRIGWPIRNCYCIGGDGSRSSTGGQSGGGRALLTNAGREGQAVAAAAVSSFQPVKRGHQSVQLFEREVLSVLEVELTTRRAMANSVYSRRDEEVLREQRMTSLDVPEVFPRSPCHGLRGKTSGTSHNKKSSPVAHGCPSPTTRSLPP